MAYSSQAASQSKRAVKNALQKASKSLARQQDILGSKMQQTKKKLMSGGGQQQKRMQQLNSMKKMAKQQNSLSRALNSLQQAKRALER
jgi:hypothetical protein